MKIWDGIIFNVSRYVCVYGSVPLHWEKTFANFDILWLFAKVFSMKFKGVSVGSTSEHLQMFSL